MDRVCIRAGGADLFRETEHALLVDVHVALLVVDAGLSSEERGPRPALYSMAIWS